MPLLVLSFPKHLEIEIMHEELLGYIEQIPVFSDFTAEEKKELCESKNHLVAYRKGQAIVRQGDMDFSLFIIMRGNVFLTKTEKPDFKITTLKQRSVFGEISFNKPHPRATNVIAETDVTVMKLNGELLEKLSESAQGKIKNKIIEILIKRLDDINNAMITYARQ
ncbi:MAG: hypothetical protein A3K09_00595 [Nitrospinae bacterium RIFCSPLOWO2_12_FULL_47_7]|nr:MAG: hypothetical protein A3K09_00595 [Nitrospinae bacterium RIFCSPLOWO2_12_FULL_47_7]